MFSPNPDVQGAHPGWERDRERQTLQCRVFPPGSRVRPLPVRVYGLRAAAGCPEAWSVHIPLSWSPWAPECNTKHSASLALGRHQSSRESVSIWLPTRREKVFVFWEARPRRTDGQMPVGRAQ